MINENQLNQKTIQNIPSIPNKRLLNIMLGIVAFMTAAGMAANQLLGNGLTGESTNGILYYVFN